MTTNKPIFWSSLSLIAVVAAAHADVTPVRASITSDALVYLTSDNGSDQQVVTDEQFGTIDPMATTASALLANTFGTFTSDASTTLTFTGADAGAFSGATSFAGVDAQEPDGIGFGHSPRDEIVYDFVTSGDGTLTVSGTLVNTSTLWEQVVLVQVASEFMPGDGFNGFFFSQQVIDTANIGSVPFSMTVPLEASSQSYRLRVMLSGGGIGLRSQVLVNSSVNGSFSIDVAAACPPDLIEDGVLDFFDVAAFLDAFSSHDPVADFIPDGVFDFFDVAAFLDAFSTGCP